MSRPSRRTLAVLIQPCSAMMSPAVLMMLSIVTGFRLLLTTTTAPAALRRAVPPAMQAELVRSARWDDLSDEPPGRPWRRCGSEADHHPQLRCVVGRPNAAAGCAASATRFGWIMNHAMAAAAAFIARQAAHRQRPANRQNVTLHAGAGEQSLMMPAQQLMFGRASPLPKQTAMFWKRLSELYETGLRDKLGGDRRLVTCLTPSAASCVSRRRRQEVLVDASCACPLVPVSGSEDMFLTGLFHSTSTMPVGQQSAVGAGLHRRPCVRTTAYLERCDLDRRAEITVTATARRSPSGAARRRRHRTRTSSSAMSAGTVDDNTSITRHNPRPRLHGPCQPSTVRLNRIGCSWALPRHLRAGLGGVAVVCSAIMGILHDDITTDAICGRHLGNRRTVLSGRLCPRRLNRSRVQAESAQKEEGMASRHPQAGPRQASAPDHGRRHARATAISPRGCNRSNRHQPGNALE